jgi:hypothetical protein
MGSLFLVNANIMEDFKEYALNFVTIMFLCWFHYVDYIFIMETQSQKVRLPWPLEQYPSKYSVLHGDKKLATIPSWSDTL